MTIRKSRISDIPRLHEIFAIARNFMVATGNPHQWVEGYPSEELLKKDIESGDSYVCISDDRIVATFVLRGGIDPTYNEIYDGAWLNDKPYATIHRFVHKDASYWQDDSTLPILVCILSLVSG